MSDVQHDSVSPKIPVSTGIPPTVIALFSLGFVMIVAILSIVGATASQGHVWPADDSAKVPLTSKPSLK
jgi:hypothetical protein